MKPLINLDELEWETWAPGDGFGQRYGAIAHRIGARKLGYNLTVVPPGLRSCPFHNHRNNEEMFFIVEGTGTLRFGGEEYPLRAHDVIACPPGGRDVAHQIINTGKTDLKFLAVSTMEPVEVAEFPDSNKVMCYVGSGPDKDLQHISRDAESLDYMDGEA